MGNHLDHPLECPPDTLITKILAADGQSADVALINKPPVPVSPGPAFRRPFPAGEADIRGTARKFHVFRRFGGQISVGVWIRNTVFPGHIAVKIELRVKTNALRNYGGTHQIAKTVFFR